jgi:hypothetical protein
MITLLPARLYPPRWVDDSTFARQRKAMERSNLDDPKYAAFAWDRYWRLMRWMVLASAIAAVASLYILYRMTGPLPIPMIIATGVGVFASVILAAGLMGLVFLSNGSGHDDSISDPFEDLDK